MITDRKTVIFALGTNVDSDRNMARMQQLLRDAFPDIRFTVSLQTEAIGIVAPPFLNCLAAVSSASGYESIHRRVKLIEAAMDPDNSRRKAGRVVCDIDILYCAGMRYHLSDWQRPYVVELLRRLPMP